jgi:carbon storage regulator CsrA
VLRAFSSARPQRLPATRPTTRRPGEAIVIRLPTGERVSVAVVRIRGNQARLSIEAPRGVSVVREELLKESAVV